MVMFSSFTVFTAYLYQMQTHHPALLLFCVAGGRYVLVAGVLFTLALKEIGRPAHPSLMPAKKKQVMREFLYSFVSVLIFAFVNGWLLYGSGLIHHSRLYTTVADYGWAWFWISIPVMLIAHDAQFYWLHRIVHLRLLFRHVHRVHHLSIYPTAWAAYSFHPWEAIFEGLIAISIIFVMPVHPAAFVIFQTISILLNAYGHSGRDFTPARWQHTWYGRWINTPTAHSLHHRSPRCNYGLYFLFWDRLMGTLGPVEKMDDDGMHGCFSPPSVRVEQAVSTK